MTENEINKQTRKFSEINNSLNKNLPIELPRSLSFPRDRYVFHLFEHISIGVHLVIRAVLF